MEAQRVLEMTNYCGGFCQNQELNAGPNTGCGCSQNWVYCWIYGIFKISLEGLSARIWSYFKYDMFH
jgi:hypothetical protein